MQDLYNKCINSLIVPRNNIQHYKHYITSQIHTECKLNKNMPL